MAVFISKLINRHVVAEDTMAFHFTRPQNWDFKAGQFIDVTLLNPPENDVKGNVRGFSITSPPYEDQIVVTTRLTGSVSDMIL